MRWHCAAAVDAETVFGRSPGVGAFVNSEYAVVGDAVYVGLGVGLSAGAGLSVGDGLGDVYEALTFAVGAVDGRIFCCAVVACAALKMITSVVIKSAALATVNVTVVPLIEKTFAPIPIPVPVTAIPVKIPSTDATVIVAAPCAPVAVIALTVAGYPKITSLVARAAVLATDNVTVFVLAVIEETTAPAPIPVPLTVIPLSTPLTDATVIVVAAFAPVAVVETYESGDRDAN